MTNEVVKQKELFRRFVSNAEFAIVRAADGQRAMWSFPASSETPVDRWYGTEVLSHDSGAVNLQRANGGAMPLLFNHDLNDPIGMVMAAELKQGRLYVHAAPFDLPRTAQVQKMMEGGLRNVSIAYRVNTIQEDQKSGTFTATDWEPLEVSIVTVPADPSVGIGRGAETEYEVRIIRASSPALTAATTEVSMPESTSNAAVATPEPPKPAMSAVEYEKERRQAIINLCKSNRIDPRSESEWIENGTPLHEISGKILDVVEERSKQKPMSNTMLGLSAKETNRYSLFKAIRAMRFGPSNPRLLEEAAFELECSREVAKKLNRQDSSSMLIPAEVLQRPLAPEAVTRAMATQPGSKGGFMVSVDNMGFIDILRNRSVAMAMGARVLGGLQGNLTFPRQTGKPSVTWQPGEGSSVTAADQTLGQLSMTPKTCIAITDVSEQLLRQASPSAESFIMADLAADVAIDGVDAAVINGTGGAQPLGIKNTTGVTTGQDAASATYAKILAFVSTAGGANAIRGNPGFVTNTAGAAKLMQVQRFTSTDTPLWTNNMMNGQLVGFNAMSSEQLASGNLIFGSWDEVVIGEWSVLELTTDNGGTRFNTATVGIRALWMVDVLVRYPQAFVVSVNLS